MGWFFTKQTDKAAFIAELNADVGSANRLVAFAVRGNHLWQLLERIGGDKPEIVGKRWIALCLLSKESDGGWGVKFMDESCGPCYYDCPLSLLNQASDPMTEYALKWRSKVREFHARKRDKSAMPRPKAGLEISVFGKRYVLKFSLGPRKGWAAHAQGSPEERYHLTAGQVKMGLLTLAQTA